MYARIAAVAAAALFSVSAGAQSAAEHIALGDRAHAAMDPAAALQHYAAAVAADSTNYEALWRASRAAVDLGEFERDAKARTRYFRDGERYARRAIEVDPRDADAHFYLARALGRRALSLGPRDRVKFGKAVRSEALRALEDDPNHPGALHVMGVWNAEVMRLSGFERFFAEKVLGGDVFGSANWADAERYMERAVAVDPDRITHRLDLAKIYADRGKKAKARELLEWVLRAPATDYNDRFYKAEAERLLGRIKG